MYPKTSYLKPDKKTVSTEGHQGQNDFYNVTPFKKKSDVISQADTFWSHSKILVTRQKMIWCMKDYYEKK